MGRVLAKKNCNTVVFGGDHTERKEVQPVFSPLNCVENYETLTLTGESVQTATVQDPHDPAHVPTAHSLCGDRASEYQDVQVLS